MNRRTLLSLSAAALLATSLGASAQQMNVIETAASQSDTTIFLKAAEATGLAEALNGPGPITLFIPSDSAFEALPPGTMEGLMLPDNREMLLEILGFHVVNGTAIMSADIAAAGDPGVKAVEGEDMAVVQNGALAGGAKILRGDLIASNGVVHIIDTVILPPTQ